VPKEKPPELAAPRDPEEDSKKKRLKPRQNLRLYMCV